MPTPTVSVVIPTLNAASEIGPLLDALLSQSFAHSEVLVVDSASEDATQDVVKSYAGRGVRLHAIDRADFDHGATRDMAARMTTGDFVMFLTQDAFPADDRLTDSLLAPMLADSDVALVSGRQLPKADARRFEQLVRGFNYPAEPSVRSEADVARLGVKAYFASDVCAMYRRSAYEACGGFPRTATNEDMIMACRFIKAGLKVAYEPSARVYHSHNLTPRQQFARNRAVGAFLERNAAELAVPSEVGEGARMVKQISKALLLEGRVGELCAFGVDCAARLLGNRAGRSQEHRIQKKGGTR